MYHTHPPGYMYIMRRRRYIRSNFEHAKILIFITNRAADKKICHYIGMLASERQVAALVGLFKGGTKLTYRKGEFIIRPSESPNAVYYIESGLVKAYNITKYGEENLLIIRK
jgi:hypothetical protein